MDLRPDRAPASEYSGPDRIPLRTLTSGIRAEGWKIWIPLGDIKFKMCDGREMLIKGVKHVPGLRRNLISLGLFGLVPLQLSQVKNMLLLLDLIPHQKLMLGEPNI